jgi:UDP-arabinose 4-epimerase
MESLAAQSSTGSRPTLLVTGGAGYIGSHACKQLDRAGFEPVTFDNLARGHRELVKWGPLEVGDLADVCRLIEVVERYRPVAVMHFAALAYVGESVREPLEYYRNNVAGSRSKLMVEQMIADMARAHGYGYVNLRYFNAAGADPDGETGELHEPETHLIPLALQAAAGHGPQLQVFGEDYPTPDGTCIRDYIHVTDLADVHVLSLQHLLGGGDSASLNLANGNGFSVREVLEAVERVAGRPVPHEVAGRRPGDPPMLVGDATLARRILGWRPRYADLDTIIETAWKFDKVAMLQYGRSG